MSNIRFKAEHSTGFSMKCLCKNFISQKEVKVISFLRFLAGPPQSICFQCFKTTSFCVHAQEMILWSSWENVVYLPFNKIVLQLFNHYR